MGQCPTSMMGPEGDSFYYDIVKCMSLDNHHEPETFLVIHDFDEENLIDKEEVERILEKDFQDYLQAGGADTESLRKSLVNQELSSSSLLENDPPENHVIDDNRNNKNSNNDSSDHLMGRCALLTDTGENEESAVLCHGPLFVETTLKPYRDILRLQMFAGFGAFYTKRYLQKPPKPISSTISHGVIAPTPPLEVVNISYDEAKNKNSNSNTTSNPVEDIMPNLVVAYSQESDSTDARDVENRPVHPSLHSDPIKLSSDGSSFLNLAVRGNLGIVLRDEPPYHHHHSPMYNTSTTTTPNIHNIIPQLLLFNEKTGELVALCRTKPRRQGFLPTVRVYSPKPRCSATSPVVEGVTYNNTNGQEQPLYLWAEFHAEGDFPLPMQYSIFLVSDRDGKIEQEPSYRGTHVDVGKICVKMLGQTKKEQRHTGCCLIQMTKRESSGKTFDDDEVTTTSRSTNVKSNCVNIKDYYSEVFISLAISRGIDPALFICLTSFIDELLESAMRRQVAKIDQSLINRQHSLYNYDSD